MRQARRRWPAVAVALLAVLAACTSGSDDGAPRPPDGTSSDDPVTVDLEVGEAATAEIAGVGRVDIAADQVAEAGTLTVSKAQERDVSDQLDDLPIAAVGAGLSVELGGGASLSAPATVTLDGDDSELEQTVVAHLHDGDWDVLPARSVDGSLEIETQEFSEFFGITIDFGALFRPLGELIARTFGGRTEPPTCQGAPDWAEVTDLPSGAAHTCVRTNPDDDAVAEVEITSNRGSFQQVEVSGLVARRYLWVEDQPDWLREAVARAIGGNEDTTVMLAPGKRMTVGYARPATTAAVEISAFPSNGALLLTYLLESVKYFVDLDQIEPLATISTLQCFDAIDFDFNRAAVSLKVPSVGADAFECLVDKLRKLDDDPNRAISEAAQLVGPSAPTEELARAAEKLQIAGRLAAVINLAGIASRVWTQAIDAAVSAFGVDNDDTVTVTLSPDVQPTGPQSCGAVTGRNGSDIDVVVPRAEVGCEEALRIVERYLTDDTLVLEGSSAFATFDGWTCWVDTIAGPNGAVGGCYPADGEGSEDQIEMHPTGSGVPDAVEGTADRIRAAAASRDLDALATLAGQNPALTYTFGDPGDSARQYWESEIARGVDIFAVLTELLGGEPAGSNGTWVWPAQVIDDPCAEYGDDDCYYGFTLNISQDGTWTAFVEGE